MMTVPRAEDPARLALEGHDLHLGYAAGEDVVAGLDISVDEGSFTVIVGPNACGKSTLLRSLSKVLPPRSGTVLLDGREISSMRPKVFACTSSSAGDAIRTRACSTSGPRRTTGR